MNTKLLIACAVLLAAYTFAVWKWSESHYRSALLENPGPRDTTIDQDTASTPLPTIRDSVDVGPDTPPPALIIQVPDSAGIAELLQVIARKDSVIAWLTEAFSESITEYAHTVHLHYRPDLRRLFYEWVPPLPTSTVTTITETKYLPAVEPPLWVDLHAGEHDRRLAGGLSVGWGPVGLTAIATAGGKPTWLATFHQRFDVPSLLGFSAGR